jgi:hypothetical protein
MLTMLSEAATFVAKSSPDRNYVQAVANVRSFVIWIESQPTPTPVPDSPRSGDAASALKAIKADSMNWINQIYPTCINLPKTFASANDQISPDLTLLTSLAQQLSSNPGNQSLHDGVANAADSLAATVAGLQGQASNLAASLSSFAGAIKEDIDRLNGAFNGVQQDIGNENWNLHNQYGELSHLKNQTCPNQNDINACRQRIEQIESFFSQMNQIAGQVQQAASQAAGACTGLNFMAGYWSRASDDGRQVALALRKAAADPPSILQLDLQSASQAWSQTSSLSQQLADQFS